MRKETVSEKQKELLSLLRDKKLTEQYLNDLEIDIEKLRCDCTHMKENGDSAIASGEYDICSLCGEMW